MIFSEGSYLRQLIFRLMPLIFSCLFIDCIQFFFAFFAIPTSVPFNISSLPHFFLPIPHLFLRNRVQFDSLARFVFSASKEVEEHIHYYL